ncbi:vacuolar protein sorting-associated protein 13A-like, partial [Asbolus verrucosus]
LGPISASARLRINQKPELDQPAYSIPKIHLNLDLEKLFVGITKAQYRDIIAFAESMDRMSKGIPYREYRPDVESYKGHYKEWWLFAYTCVLEGEIKRKRRNWDWNHIFQHRELCREYGKLYQKKLRNTLNAKDQVRIEECEKNIDIFNVVIIRQRIELETERHEKTQTKSSSWFGWVWGSKSANQGQVDVDSGTEIMKQFENAMSKEEKARLYKAIDYQENALPTQFPEEYVDNSCTFLLRTLEVELCDDSDNVQRVVFTELKGVRCRIDTRAAANAVKVHVKIDEFTTFGLQQENFIPRMITSETGGGDTGLLEVSFETNPLDKTCGQRLYITSQPLKIVYDAQTIIKVVDIFKIPSSSALDQISAAADSGLANFKEMSSTGLQYAIDTHILLDLRIDLQAPYIIIPYGGKYTENENVLVINLGNLHMYSRNRPVKKDIRKMHAEGIDDKEILKQLIAQSYDEFEVELNSLQIMVAQTSEDWKNYIKESKTADMHILHPVNLKVNISKCMITDDPRLPLSKISGKLPSIVVDVTDARLLLLMALVSSIPLPQSDVPEPAPLTKDSKKSSSMVMLKYWEMQDTAQKTKKLLPETSTDVKKDQFVQFTTVEMHFVMSELSLNLKHQDHVEAPANNVASFNAKSLEFDLIQQTYNTKVLLRLASIGLTQCYNNKEINIISSPGFEIGEQYLFEIKFIQVDKGSPEFHSVFHSCETCLILTFAKLGIILHKESLLALIQFATGLQSDLEEAAGLKGDLVRKVSSTSTPNLKKQLSTISEGFGQTVESKKKKKKPIVVETIKFKLSGTVQELNAQFSCDKQPLSSWTLKGIHSDIIVKSSYTQINAKLNQIIIVDLNPESVHKMILSVSGEEALSARVVLYNLDENVETEKSDLSVDVTMGGLKIVFLNWFVTRMLDFLNEFQAAQAALIEASQAAAQSAKENMQSAYAKATKLSLNIDLKAPDIIIPANSKSHDAVLLDLGHISISNKFLTLDIKNEKNFSAVIDEMRLNLTDLKVSRVKLDNKNEIVNELTLLVPLTFKLIIKRNLTSSWYKAVPDIDIIGQIDSITLLLSQQDYKTIMSILSGNLAEGSTPKPSPEVKQVLSNSATLERPSDIHLAKESSSNLADKTLHTNLESKADTFVKFTFTMDKLIVSLFTGGSKALSGESPCHDDNNGLARFSLEGISLKARILSDNSIMASFLLLNCLLDDMRKGREDKLNRLVQRSREDAEFNLAGSAASRSMIDLTVRIKDNHTFLDVRVFSFTVILSVDYLLKIADFLTLPESESSKPSVPQKSVATKSTATLVVNSAEESQITLNLKIEKPDIILVEHMDNIDTKALVLNSEIVIKFRSSGAHQVINGTIKDLELYTCCYNPLRRSDTRGNVLHPVTISLAGSTPENKGLHLELLVTDIRLSVSPATIELLSRVTATATGSGTAESIDEEHLKNYSDIWEQKPYDDQDFWFLKGDEAVEATEALSAQLIKSTSRHPSQEVCIVLMPVVILTIEAGVGQKTLPMLILESSFKGSVWNWSSQMSVDAGLTLQMSYYNSRLALWEPLIEPVEVTKNNRSALVPWELKLEVSMNEPEEIISPTEGGSVDLNMQQQALMNIDIISDHSMELVITKTCGIQLAGNSSIAKNYSLFIKVNDKNCELELPVVRADKRYFPLNYRGEGNDNWGLISDVKVDEGVTVITLRSILQVYNHFDIPIEVYYMTARGNELASITTVEPDSVVNIPLNAVYTPTNELFFSVAGYSVTTTPYIWKDLQTNLTVTKTLQCSPKDLEFNSEPFIIQAVGEMEQVYFENTCRHTMSSTCYNIHLRPAVVFKNCLPLNIDFCIENTIGEISIEPGKTLLLPNVEPGRSCLVV